MEEMIKISKAYIRIARPQISACLLSVLDNDRLRTAAFSCWTTLLLYLEEEDVEVLAETTFHIISHYWRSFDEESRQKAVDTLQKLIETYGSYFERNIHKLPSLGHIEELAPVEALLQPFRKPLDNRTAFAIYAERLRHENSGVVLQALTELSRYLEKHQDFLQTSAISEQPDDVVTTLMRALLDCNAKYNGVDTEISRLCTECIGSVGCLDSNRLDATRVRRQFVVLTNFEDSEEMKDFVLFTLEEVLVDKFLSASSDTKLQGFLSFAMQELLDKCDFRAACLMQEANIPEAEETYKKWLRLPESVREVLTPFLNSKYKLAPMTWQKVSYPIFRPGRMMYGNWLRPFVTDLLHREQSPMANLIFRPLCRLIRVKDFSIGEFLLPYAVLHVIIGDQSTQADRDNVIGELRIVLEYQLPEDATSAQREDMKLCCEVCGCSAYASLHEVVEAYHPQAVFRVLDYAMQWLHAKKAIPSQNHRDSPAIKRVQMLLDSIPAELISQKAMDCKAYSRALFHLEQHIRQVQEKNKDPKATSRLLEQLQDIYAQIDEPDGLDGIAAHLHVLDINHQMLSHRKAGRWTAAQTWYEIRLTEDPGNIDTRLDLLTCLKESGQHGTSFCYTCFWMSLV